ncbi:DUF2797 domain-containing protein [Yinghuangia soli]|uniref:DUF2797 domain-containing protein n=1 Tax=Yinghuangia soli TaxID=2908204 RepID=A0AA41PYB8_9ACTN|nr:DUF2797 domain-containing protein [Yinghuangia soli]MCF2528143.1 DUF2797 domain-containing protein [Yinghuangia soli]
MRTGPSDASAVSDAEPAPSPLERGGRLAFAVGADRLCGGVWRGGRRIACALRAELPAKVLGGMCPDCQAMDRSSSIAADTRVDDPRPFMVYLAYHGAGTVKVGITAAERGNARLWEQGALASVALAEGPLMAARRTEHLLGTALGLPDRVATRVKRLARFAPGTAEQRLAALREVRDLTVDLPGWPDSLARRFEEPLDHAAAYGLPDAGIRPDAELAPLVPGSVIAGRLACVIGSDLYLAVGAGSARLVLVDSRLLAGWALQPATGEAEFAAATAVPVLPRETAEPDALF